MQYYNKGELMLRDIWRTTPLPVRVGSTIGSAVTVLFLVLTGVLVELDIGTETIHRLIQTGKITPETAGILMLIHAIPFLLIALIAGSSSVWGLYTAGDTPPDWSTIGITFTLVALLPSIAPVLLGILGIFAITAFFFLEAGGVAAFLNGYFFGGLVFGIAFGLAILFAVTMIIAGGIGVFITQLTADYWSNQSHGEANSSDST
jgi:hypothetical protein